MWEENITKVPNGNTYMLELYDFFFHIFKTLLIRSFFHAFVVIVNVKWLHFMQR